ncbi:MAG: HAD family hydrolase [Ignavibacteriales bacterium]
MKNYVVAFDLDGLMIDSENFYLKLIINYNNQNGHHFTKKFYIENCLGKKRDQITLELSKLWGESFDFETYWKELFIIRNEALKINKIKKKKGLMKLLKYLKSNNIKTAIVSSSSTEMIKMLLNNSDISLDYFDKIIGSELVANVKPSPDLYTLACKMFDIDPKKMFAIEDSRVGIEAAYNAGVKPILIPDLIVSSTEVEKRIIAKFNSLDEIIPFLQNLE